MRKRGLIAELDAEQHTVARSSSRSARAHPALQTEDKKSSPAFCPGGQAQEACSENSHSLPGASVVEQCDCDAGYWRECIVDTTTGLAVDGNGDPCTIEHARACVECGEDVVCANNTLIHCPANSTAPAGTSDANDCVCEPGFKEVAVLHRL